MYRKPQNQIKKRPHVLAADRFLTWLTPYANRKILELERTFLAHLIVRHRIANTKSVKKETLENYAAGLICFTSFCDDHDIPDESRMPASESLLAHFISTCAVGSVGKGTANSWLLGLELWHIINKAPWHGSKLLNCVLKATEKLAPASSHRKNREAVTIDHIRALRKRLNLADSLTPQYGQQLALPFIQLIVMANSR